MPTKLQRYWKCDIGNSTHGPIGAVIRVLASTREAALSAIRRNLPEILYEETGFTLETRVYLNATAITLSDVVEDND